MESTLNLTAAQRRTLRLTAANYGEMTNRSGYNVRGSVLGQLARLGLGTASMESDRPYRGFRTYHWTVFVLNAAGRAAAKELAN